MEGGGDATRTWFLTGVVYVPTQLTLIDAPDSGGVTRLCFSSPVGFEPSIMPLNSSCEKSENFVTPCTAVPPAAASATLRASAILRFSTKNANRLASSAAVS